MEKVDLSSHLGMLPQSWLRKIKEAEKAKEQFTEVGEMCRQFFSGSVGFMWEDKFRSRYLKSVTPPRFRVTIAKAFELVAVFGPSLFWRYPGRVVKSREVFMPDPRIFGDPNDEQVQQLLQQAQKELDDEEARRKTRDKLMETYLNYSQREQPGGGLKCDGQYAVTEALVKGRGVTWCETYSFPGSQRLLTRSVFDTVDNLFIDPCSKRPNISDAKWIARKHCEKYWEVERRFNLKPGSLRDKAKLKSADKVAADSVMSKPNASAEQEGDMVTWYEIFSKCGVGTRESGVLPAYHEAFEQTVGDYAYICVCSGVDYPLNAPKDKFESAYEDQILEMFDWPVPYYKDGKWPCAILDFYPNPNSAWPLAPMSMGLGELMFLNTMMSVLCERTYENSRLLVAAMKGAASEAVSKIRSGGMKEIIEINPELPNTDIRNLIQVLQLPEIGFDLFRMINMVSAMFDKRTGLTELLYGMNPGGTASRTATDINVRSEMASVRPEYMSQQVEEWQSEVTNIERIAAGWSIVGRDIEPLVGKIGAQLWDELITNEDPELFVREMRCTIEANSIRKPNKSKDNENIQRISQFLFPELSKHADVTGDTQPINNFIEDLGAAMDQDTKRWALPPRNNEPDPEQAELQKRLQELAAAKEEVGIQKAMAETEGIQVDTQKTIMDMQGQGEVGGEDMQTELDMRALEAEMELQAKEAEMVLDLESKMAENEIDLQYQEDLNKLKLDTQSVA